MKISMKVSCAFISLCSCFFLLVSAEDITCPPGAPSTCKCGNILDDLKVECKDEDRITDIPSWLTNNTNRLEFENCDIRFLNRDSFKNLVNLTVVKILKQQHRLTFNDSFVFQGFKRLLGVDFDNNNIASLPAGLFANLPRLNVVGLNNNPLATLPDDLLENSTNVQHFRIGNTRLDRDIIGKIGQGHFGTNITSLMISGTFIEHLKDGLFIGLPKLENLAIGNCGIKSIGADILKGTEILSIALDGNPIEFINENAFRDSKVGAFECVRCLLTSNVTFSGFLKKMPLNRISLRNNQLTHVPKDAFTGLRDLSIIDLSNNSIATIENNPYANLPKCDNSACVQLHDNPFNCDCNLAWLRSFADNIQGDKTLWKCARPPSVSGKSLVSLEVNEVCHTKSKPTNKSSTGLSSTVEPTLSSTVEPTNDGTLCSICVVSAILAAVVHMIVI